MKSGFCQCFSVTDRRSVPLRTNAFFYFAAPEVAHPAIFFPPPALLKPVGDRFFTAGFSPALNLH
jgi:hypothetical protein